MDLGQKLSGQTGPCFKSGPFLSGPSTFEAGETSKAHASFVLKLAKTD